METDPKYNVNLKKKTKYATYYKNESKRIKKINIKKK